MKNRLLLACLLTLSTGAQAHALLKMQEPQANAVIKTPAEIRLAFSEPIEPDFSSIKVLDESGKRVALITMKTLPESTLAMHAGLPALAAGHYTVVWAVLARDGHRSTGTYRFSVN